MKTLSEMIAVMKAAEEGKTIEFREVKSTHGWLASNPSWNWTDYDYRIAISLRKVKLLAYYDGDTLVWKCSQPLVKLPSRYLRVPAEDKIIEVEVEK